MFRVHHAELITINQKARDVFFDLQVLNQLSWNLPRETAIACKALMCANDMINAINIKDEKTLDDAKNISRAFFNERELTPSHHIWAVGHCHIDTAWLWPFDETKRKCARSWSSQLLYEPMRLCIAD